MRFELGLEKPDPRRALVSASDDRRSLHRWRSHPALALHLYQRVIDGSAHLRGHDPGCVVYLWIC